MAFVEARLGDEATGQKDRAAQHEDPRHPSQPRRLDHTFRLLSGRRRRRAFSSLRGAGSARPTKTEWNHDLSDRSSPEEQPGEALDDARGGRLSLVIVEVPDQV